VIFLPILATNWLPWRRPLDPCNQKCLLWIGRPQTPPVMSNRNLVISHRNAFIAMFVPKLVAMVTPLQTSPGCANVHPSSRPQSACAPYWWCPLLSCFEYINHRSCPHPKRHLDWFSHFCRACCRDRPPDRPTDRRHYYICNNEYAYSPSRQSTQKTNDKQYTDIQKRKEKNQSLSNLSSLI